MAITEQCLCINDNITFIDPYWLSGAYKYRPMIGIMHTGSFPKYPTRGQSWCFPIDNSGDIFMNEGIRERVIRQVPDEVVIYMQYDFAH
jgi:hypothetical protein